MLSFPQQGTVECLMPILKASMKCGHLNTQACLVVGEPGDLIDLFASESLPCLEPESVLL